MEFGQELVLAGRRLWLRELRGRRLWIEGLDPKAEMAAAVLAGELPDPVISALAILEQEVAEHGLQRTLERTQRELGRDRQIMNRLQAGREPHASRWTLALFSLDAPVTVAASQSCPEYLFEILAASRNGLVMVSLGSKRWLDDRRAGLLLAEARRTYDSHKVTVGRVLANNRSLSLGFRRSLLGDWHVAHTFVRSGDAPHNPELLEVLIRHPKEDVRQALASQQMTPELALEMRYDPSPEVRAEVARALGEVVAELARDPHPKVRAAVAANRHLSPPLLRVLAMDPTLTVQLAVFERASGARLTDVLELLAQTPHVAIGRALAGEPGLSKEAYRAILKLDDSRCRYSLSNNDDPNAQAAMIELEERESAELGA